MSSLDTFATDFYGQLAKVVKAIGNKTRLEILVLLAQGERTVDSIAKEIKLPVTNTSHHLRDLRDIGVVVTRKQGVHVSYSLSDDSVYDLVVSVCEIAERKSALFQDVVETYLGSRDSMEAMTAEHLVESLKTNNLTLIDVRPSEEYAAGHLPGAVNVPLEEIEAKMPAMDENQGVVAYCRGPYCILAYEAVSRLRQKGFKAYRLKDGLPEWKKLGLPIDVT